MPTQKGFGIRATGGLKTLIVNRYSLIGSGLKTLIVNRYSLIAG
jgi:hypothetical protein